MKGTVHTMKKLIAAGNLYLKKIELTDIALIKLCVGAIGVLVGLGAAKKHKRTAGLLAGVLFVATYIPLMGKLIRVLVDSEED